MIAAYAVAHIPGASEPEFEVFDRATIDRYRGYSRGGNIWQSHFVEMAKKAVLGQLLKRLPKAVGAPPEPDALPESFIAGLEGLDGVIEGDSRAVDTDTGEIVDEPPTDGHLCPERKPRQPEQQPPAPEPVQDEGAPPAEEPAEYDPDDAPF